MKRMDTGKHRKWLALLLVVTLLTGLLPQQQTEAQDEAQNAEEITEETDYGLSNPRKSASVLGPREWDCVYFGHYWQSDTNDDGIADKEDAKEPILWRVLSVDGDDAFLLAEHNLEVKEYCERTRFSEVPVTWENSTIRSWLNGYDGDANLRSIDYTDDNFLDDAFSLSEQAAIRETNVENRDNWIYDTEAGNDTTDKVYLLSFMEAITEKYGFATSIRSWTDTRSATDTDYVWGTRRELSAGSCNSIYKEDEWWLRSPGAAPSTLDKDQYPTGIYPSNRAVILRGGKGDPPTQRYCGYINADGDYADADKCVRPVLHIDLSQRSCWTYAGTVSAQPIEENLLPAPEPEETPVRSEQPAQTPDLEPLFPGTNNTPVPPVTGSDGVTTWDCVYFGHYWQNDNNQDGTADRKDAKEKIKWRVLSVDGDDVLLLADKALECQPYNETWVDVTWAASTMRSWLNGYGADANLYGKNYTHNNFLDYAFTPSEQAAIKDTTLVNADNEEFGTEGGEDTTDQVYLLSKDDMVNHAYGFSDDDVEGRCAKTTKYSGKGQSEYLSEWWLRSPADKSTEAYYVSMWGYVSEVEAYVDDVFWVRPALHLNLACRSCWSNAGKVTSDGKVMEPAAPTPTATPTAEPTVAPEPTGEPTATPTVAPEPAGEPTVTPSIEPTVAPEPTGEPAVTPAVSGEPTGEPPATPSTEPSVTQEPTGEPPATPSTEPSVTQEPAGEPPATPSTEPSVTQEPAGEPPATPSIEPTVAPEPAGEPSATPSTAISETQKPAGEPSAAGTLTEAQQGSQAAAVTTATQQLLPLGKVTGLKLKAKKRAIQARWKKCPGAAGYEIWYSTSKKWKKKKVKLTKTTKRKLKKLKPKKVYYVRIRAYTIQNGKKRYGKWSKTGKKRCR